MVAFLDKIYTLAILSLKMLTGFNLRLSVVKPSGFFFSSFGWLREDY